VVDRSSEVAGVGRRRDGSNTVAVSAEVDDVGALVARAIATFEIALGVPGTQLSGPLDNTASVTSATADPDTSDNESTATVEAVAQADVTRARRDSNPQPFDP
jgi:hypothetical protein